MATSLVVNGVSYLYPDTGDQSWGTVASAWAAAITSGTLQKAGGAFALTADANFGANFGLLSKYFTSQTANAAASGIVRLANTEAVAWRNNANGGDVLLAKNSSDQLTWNGTVISSAAGVTPVAAGGTGLTSGTSGGILGFTATGTLASSALLAASQVVIGGGASATPTTLTAGSQYQVLAMGAANPAWGALNLAQAAAVTGTLANANTTAVSAATASTILARDANSNAQINNLIENYATTAAAGGSGALTVASAGTQYFTGSSTYTITLPDATTLVLGHSFFIVNLSSGVVTVNKNGATLVQAMAANSFMWVQCTNIGSAAGAWTPSYSVNNAGGGTVTSVTYTGDGVLQTVGPTTAVTTTGTLAPTLITQTARAFFCGPQSGAAATPTFKALTVPLVTVKTATGATTGYLFTITTTSTCAVGDTYTNNGHTYTVQGALSAQSGQVLFMSQASAPAGSGNLIQTAGSGTATIAFTSSVVTALYTCATSPPPLYLRVRMIGGGGGGAGGGSGSGGGGNAGSTYFGSNLLLASGGSGSAATGGGIGGSGGSLGTATGLLINGGDGNPTGANGGLTSVAPGGGNGGVSPFGGSGAGGAPGGGGAAAAVANTGSGGGGGGGNTTAGSLGGGGGGAGQYIDAIVPFAATFLYIVGGGGTLGSAGGSGGGPGTAGATGVLEVTEFYQ